MKERLLIIFIALMYAIGLLAHLFFPTLPWMLRLTPFVLFMLGLIALFPVIQEKQPKIWLWCIFTYLFTFFLEVIGLATGGIFGPYIYGDTLGFQLWGVPAVIGFNWLLVILGSVNFANQLVKHTLLSTFLVGVLTVVFDYVMEPIAVKLNYWRWYTAFIPVENYIAWFLVAFFTAGIYNWGKLKIHTKLPMMYFLIQFLFFLFLRFLL